MFSVGMGAALAALLWQIPDLLGKSLPSTREFYLHGHLRWVEREKSRPLAHLPVRLEALDGSLRSASSTDSQGTFSFARLPPGQYYVWFRIEGYREIRRTVDVTATLADAAGGVVVSWELSPSQLTPEWRDPSRTVPLRRLRLPSKARKSYEKALKASQSGRAQEVERHLERALEVAPDFVEALNNLGALRFRQGRLEEAASLFQRAVQIDPQLFEPLLNLGGALLGLQRWEEAEKVNRRALALDPKDALANAQLGIALERLGRDGEALHFLGEALRWDPNLPTFPRLLRAEIFLRNQQREAAIRELEEFLAVHPDLAPSPRVLQRLNELRGGARQPHPPS